MQSPFLPEFHKTLADGSSEAREISISDAHADASAKSSSEAFVSNNSTTSRNFFDRDNVLSRIWHVATSYRGDRLIVSSRSGKENCGKKGGLMLSLCLLDMKFSEYKAD